jgi:hypothetical protein
MAQTYGPTGEGVKPKLGVDATMGDSLAMPGGAQLVSGSMNVDIPEFAAPATRDAGEIKPAPAGATPDFAGPGGAQGFSHGK